MQTRSPWALLALAVSFVGGMVARNAYPQNPPPPRIVLVSSMKVQPAKVNKYLELEQKIWKPLHQARIKAGNGRSWSLYEARFPSGTSTNRDYLTINVFDSMQEFDQYGEALFKVLPQVYPTKTADQLISEAVATRDIALEELWVEIDRVDRN
jgi:hypothetical protein